MLIVNKNHRTEQGSRFTTSQSSRTYCLHLCMCASRHGNCVTTAAMWAKLHESVTLMHLWDTSFPFAILLQSIHHGKFCTKKKSCQKLHIKEHYTEEWKHSEQYAQC